MPQYPNRQFLNFEQPIKDLYEQIEQTKKLAEKNPKIDYSSTLQQLEDSIVDKRREITEQLTPWQRVQLSRHPDRPYTFKYISKIADNFVELHGDRNFADDKAMVGGFAQFDGQTVMFIGLQKGINTKARQLRNFGMSKPEGYRKALRLMKLAEKFNKPVITMIDTPGAFPGLEGEERGQGEAIARNIYEMIRLKVPIICVIIGEGASGGALGIGVGDKTLMMENTWYTVISPEGCSSILWRGSDKKEVAAEQLRLTSIDMKGFKLVDEIVPEPVGGAHWDYDEAAVLLKQEIKKALDEVKSYSPDERINLRINKYCQMGFWQENEQAELQNAAIKE